MQDCPFCDPDLRGRTIEENDTSRIIFSNPRLTKGHLLTIPKRHIEEPWQLTAQEIRDAFDLIHKYQEKLAKTLGTGCDIRQNYRPFMPQGRVKVNHVHFHLVPRTLKDELFEKSQQFETAMFNALSTQERAEVEGLLSDAS